MFTALLPGDEVEATFNLATKPRKRLENKERKELEGEQVREEGGTSAGRSLVGLCCSHTFSCD